MIKMNFNIQYNDEIFNAKNRKSALKLFKEKAIKVMTIHIDGNINAYKISATVGSYMNSVEFVVDYDTMNLSSFACDCPFSIDDELACGHMGAVLLTLKALDIDRFPYVYKRVERVIDPWEEEKPVYQDYRVNSLIRRYEEIIIRENMVQVNIEKNTVDIYPSFKFLENRSYMEFKIGVDKLYVIKNLNEFVNAVENHNIIKYGKNLQFMHHVDCFTPIGKKIYDMMKISVAYENKARQYESKNYRYLPLEGVIIDQVYEVMRSIEDVKINSWLSFSENYPSLQINVSESGKLIHLSLLQEVISMQGVYSMYVYYEDCLYRLPMDYAKTCMPLINTLSGNHDMAVGCDSMNKFSYTILNHMQGKVEFIGDDFSKYQVDEVSVKIYLDFNAEDELTVYMEYIYESEKYIAYTENSVQTNRDYLQEIKIRLFLDDYIDRVDNRKGIAYVIDQEKICDLLSEGILDLQNMAEVFVSDAVKRYNIMRKPRITLGVRIENDLLSIDMSSLDFPLSELSQILNSYQLKRRYHRLKNGTFIDLRNETIEEVAQLVDTMNIPSNQIGKETIEMDKYRSLYLNKSLNKSNELKIQRSAEYRKMIENFEHFDSENIHVPFTMDDTMRDYQKTGYRWLKTMAAYGFGGILADDMGIGKTIQMIAVMESSKMNQEKGVSLVVCPASLLYNWQNEVYKFSTMLNPCIITGTMQERKELLSKIDQYDVMITSYDYLRRDIDLYESLQFHFLVLDEAQFIKNQNTKNAACVKAIQAKQRFALTGTPIENSLAELWSIFDFLMPGYLSNYAQFKKRFETPIVKETDKKALSNLRKMVEPFILRRIKKDVLSELPDKIEIPMKIDFEEDEKKLYFSNLAKINNELHSKIQESGFEKNQILILALLTRLRQICCDTRLVYENATEPSSKLNACMELIESCVEAKQKVILFSQFTSMLSLIQDELNKRKIKHHLLTGATKKVVRQEMVESFKEDDIPVFLISLKAGGTGLNLTSAEVVIHYDPWWNYSAESQATDRAYRIGQKKNVLVYKLIMKNSIEEKIQLLQNKKKEISDSIINQSDGSITSLSKDEILQLFNEE